MPLSLRSWSPRLIRRQGVVNFISGLGDTVGQRLASHRGIGMVSLTGSVETGSKVMTAAAGNVTKVNLELRRQSARHRAKRCESRSGR